MQLVVQLLGPCCAHSVLGAAGLTGKQLTATQVALGEDLEQRGFVV